MYIEELLWIRDELKVELPNSYYYTMSRYPFYDHENSRKIGLFDQGEYVIDATKKYREDKNWPQPWICIGMDKKGPFAMNCETLEIILAKDGDLNSVEKKVSEVASFNGLISIVHDGYRGKLPELMPRKDSSFKWRNVIKEIPWSSSKAKIYPGIFSTGGILRVDQESGTKLIACLKNMNFHIIEVDGRKMQDEELFFEEMSRAIGWGLFDDWLELSTHLDKKLQSVSKGGILQVSLVWKYSDQTLKDNPNLFIDAVYFFSTYDTAPETGSHLQCFFLGAPENGYEERVL